ncbi:MAG TPA: hypothetical protein VGN27_13760 [Gaiellaceae bacterium]|nr:hypothetical protein [Gaiellaceae bacterium]
MGAARRFPLWAAALSAAAVTGVAGATVAWAVTSHRGGAVALPQFHGEATWPAGARPAPWVPHGRTALVAFVGTCGVCESELRRIVRRLPAAERPALVLPAPTRAEAYGVARGRRVVLLVDRNGDERTGYSFPLAPGFVEGDLRTLATAPAGR